MSKKVVLSFFIFLSFQITQIPAFSDVLNPDWVPDIKKPDWAPDISAEVAFETKYICRGQNLGDDPVIQPGGSIILKGFTFSVWGNFDTGDTDRLTEWDYIFDYTFNIGELREKLATGGGIFKFMDPLSVSAGYTYYTFPTVEHDEKGAHDSHEFYIGASYDTLFQPFITYYYDFDTGAGSYLEFGGGHTFQLPGNIALNLGIITGYNAGQWGYDRSFSNTLFSGSVDIPVLKYFTISPDVNYSLALDKQYDSEFYGGVKISAAF